MPVPSPLGESVRETLDAFPGVSEHPAGHSQYMLRYKAPGGASFAVQRVEITSVRFWALQNDTFAECVGKTGLAATLHTPPSKGKPGRNSNLDQIPEFKGKPLHWVPVASPAQAVSLVGLLVATTLKASEPERETLPEPVVEPTPEPEPVEAIEAAPTEASAPEPVIEQPAADLPPTVDAHPVEPPAMQTHAAPAESPPRPIPPTPVAPVPRRGLLRGVLSAIFGRNPRRR